MYRVWRPQTFKEASIKSLRRKLAMLLALLCGGAIINIVVAVGYKKSAKGDQNAV